MAESADRGIFHGAVEFIYQPGLDGTIGPRHRFFHPGGANSAGDALATALIPEEPSHPTDQILHVTSRVEGHDDARTERHPSSASILKRKSKVKVLRSNEGSC
jgi:hypothetical protein